MQSCELILAVDVPDKESLPHVVDKLPNALRWLKIGLELFCAEGPRLLQHASLEQRQVFLDLKLHDIPRTVERAVAAASRNRVRLLTVHAGGGRAMVEAAVQAARNFGPDAPKIIAVTALTSLGETDLRDIGVHRSMREHVLALAELALGAGAHGLVCSPHEIAPLRERFGDAPLLVVPGIRSSLDAPGDQKRTAAAADAVRAGANYLVVGRPILDAPDPRTAAQRLLDEIALAR